MNGQPRNPSSEPQTDFAAAFAGMLELFGVLPSGQVEPHPEPVSDEATAATPPK